MRQILTRATGTRVIIACKAFDGESCDYAEQIAQVFRTAQWVVEPVNKTLLADLPDVVGIYQPFPELPQEAVVLQEALSAAGIRHEVGILNENDKKQHGENKMYLLVGRKESILRR